MYCWSEESSHQIQKNCWGGGIKAEIGRYVSDGFWDVIVLVNCGVELHDICGTHILGDGERSDVSESLQRRDGTWLIVATEKGINNSDGN